MVQDRNVSGWWYPSLEGSWPGGYGSPRQPPLVKLAWRGRSDVCPNVGIYWYGLDNPYPDRSIRSIDFSPARDGAIYAVAGLTLADQPLDQRPPAVSFGGPDNWAAGAVVYGLVEGLAGVEDRDVAYRVALERARGGGSVRWITYRSLGSPRESGPHQRKTLFVAASLSRAVRSPPIRPCKAEAGRDGTPKQGATMARSRRTTPRPARRLR